MWFDRRNSRPVVVGPLSVESAGTASRIAADVDGTRVWLESDDTALRAAPEAFGAAFLLPALHHGRALELADPVDTVWLGNTAKLQPIFRRWWGYPMRAVRATSAPVSAASTVGGARALFFSGGADSFYSLLRAAQGFDRLVLIHGFDVPLDDAPRLETVTRLVRSVAEERGLRAIVVRTNLRAHRLIAPVSWERAHGGVLAAVGHALGDGVTDVIISSSIAIDREKPWGSHWRADPLHSSASRRFEQVGMEMRRVKKLREIGSEPLLKRHLRVCWKNQGDGLNCQCCEKCLLTRMVLADCGALDGCATLDGPATLAQDVDAIDRYRGMLRALGELAVSPRLDPAIRAAAQRLLQRSRHAKQPWVRARRAVLRQVNTWTAGARS